MLSSIYRCALYIGKPKTFLNKYILKPIKKCSHISATIKRPMALVNKIKKKKLTKSAIIQWLEMSINAIFAFDI